MNLYIHPRLTELVDVEVKERDPELLGVVDELSVTVPVCVRVLVWLELGVLVLL